MSCFISGSQGEALSTLAIRQFAVYIANLFYLTSDARAPVVRDRDLEEQTADQHNLIIVGSPLENSWAARYHGKIPLKFQDKRLTLGEFNFFIFFFLLFSTQVPEVFFRREETRQERERSGERKPLVAGDANLTIMLR